jgi:hypothetical protein
MQVGSCDPSSGLICLQAKANSKVECLQFIAAGPVDYSGWLRQFEQRLSKE